MEIVRGKVGWWVYGYIYLYIWGIGQETGYVCGARDHYKGIILQ